MTGLQWLGAAFIAAFLLALLLVTVWSFGWRQALAIWGIGALGTCCFVFGGALLTGAIS